MGDVKKGFILTKLGEVRAKRTESLLSSPKAAFATSKKRDESKRTIDNYKIAEQILKLNIYKKFVSEGPGGIQEIEFYDLIKAGPYTPPDKLKEYYSDLKKIAAEAGDKRLDDFLNALREKFDYLFKGGVA